MDKAQRAEMLRQRFKEKVGKWGYVGSGRTRPKQDPETGRLDSQSFGLAVSHRWGRTQWLEAPDPKPKPTVKTKNRKGVPAVTLIAAKAPKKLARAYRTAEDLLAERARR